MCDLHKLDPACGACRELASLQSVYQAERLESDKVRQLLAYEETRRCNLERTLDQAHKQAKDQKRSLQNKVGLTAGSHIGIATA